MVKGHLNETLDDLDVINEHNVFKIRDHLTSKIEIMLSNLEFEYKEK
jgi:hypothetical protein